MANERLHGEKQFQSKNCLLEMHRSHAKMHTTKTELCNCESYIKKLYIRMQLQLSLHVPA